MPFTLEALAALALSDPAYREYSALILEEGLKPDANEASVLRAVFSAKESAHKAKVSAMQAELDAAHAAKADLDKHVAQLEANLKKIEAHIPAHKDPGGDDQGGAPVAKKRSEMKRAEKAAFIAKHGKDAYLALED